MKNSLDILISAFAERDFAAGNDLILLSDFEKSFNDLFRRKVYTLGEISYCEQFDRPLLRYASTWAAKEAVYKAVRQLSPHTLPFKNIEISRNKIAGVPRVCLPEHFSGMQISLTISHDGDYAWAIAIIKK